MIKGDFGLNGKSKRPLFSCFTTSANRSLIVIGSLGVTFCPVLPPRSSSEGSGVVGKGGGTSGDVACDEDTARDALRNDSGISGDTDPSGRLIFVSAIVSSIDILASSVDTPGCSIFLSLPNTDISIFSCFDEIGDFGSCICSEIRGEILFDKVLPALTGIRDLSEILPKWEKRITPC